MPEDECLRALRTAPGEYAQLYSERGIKLGLRTKIPSAADEVYDVGDRGFEKACDLVLGHLNFCKVKKRWVEVDSKGPESFSVSHAKRTMDSQNVFWTEVLKARTHPRLLLNVGAHLS